jgi:hypothetical protein
MAVLERLQLLIEASATDATRTIRGVGDESEKAGLRQRFLSNESNVARTALDSMGLSAVSTGTALKGAAIAGGGLAAIGIAKFAVDAAGEFTSLASEVRNFQRASGASAEDSSRFVAVLDDMEISSEKGSTAIFKLGREISSGGANLAKFGIEVARNKDGTANLSETLLNVADAYVGTRDSADRAGIAQAAFGRGGKELIAILEQGRKGLAEFFEGAEEGHQIFTQEDLANARQYELAIDDLQDTLRGLKLEAGSAVAPILTQVAHSFSETVEGADNLTASIGGLGGVLTTANNFAPWTAAAHAASGATKLLEGDVGGAAGEFTRSIPIVGGFVSSIFGAEEATDKLGDAQKRLSESQATMAQLAVEGKTKTDEYRDAQRDAKSAAEELSGAQEKVAESFQTVADKAAISQAAILAEASAKLGAAGAALGLQTALDQQEEAQRKATEAQEASNFASAMAALANGENAELNAAAAEASETLSDAKRNEAQANLGVVSSVAAFIQKKGEESAALAAGDGPQAQNKARTDAQREAYEGVIAMFPGLKGELDAYFGKLGETPHRKDTNLHVHTPDDWKIGDTIRKLNELGNRPPTTVYIDIVQRTLGGINPI